MVVFTHTISIDNSSKYTKIYQKIYLIYRMVMMQIFIKLHTIPSLIVRSIFSNRLLYWVRLNLELKAKMKPIQK